MEFQQQGLLRTSVKLEYAFCNSSLKYLVLVQQLVEPTKIERWAVVNFSARCDTRSLVRDLQKCAGMKGIVSRVNPVYFS